LIYLPGSGPIAASFEEELLMNRNCVRTKLLLLSLVAVAAMLTSCASAKQYVPFPDQTKQIEDPEKGRIYVLRPTSYGGAATFRVYDSEELIGKTKGRGFLCWEREPGETEIMSRAENRARKTISVEKGKVYYIRQRVTPGIMSAQNFLELLDEDEGVAKVQKCNPPVVELK